MLAELRLYWSGPGPRILVTPSIVTLGKQGRRLRPSRALSAAESHNCHCRCANPTPSMARCRTLRVIKQCEPSFTSSATRNGLGPQNSIFSWTAANSESGDGTPTSSGAHGRALPQKSLPLRIGKEARAASARRACGAKGRKTWQRPRRTISRPPRPNHDPCFTLCRNSWPPPSAKHR